MTDTINNCVSVFTTDNVYVTSFGQRGNKEGDFNRPYYLYIDKDQFLYVGDTWNEYFFCFVILIVYCCYFNIFIIMLLMSHKNNCIELCEPMHYCCLAE